MIITPKVNMITRQKTLFFHLLFELYSFAYFIFVLQDLQNLVPWGRSFENTHLLVKDAAFKSVSINVVRCVIWYHFYNLKKVKNTHGAVLHLVKLQAFRLQLYSKYHSSMGAFHVF